jgi:hypothetical protein
LVIFLERVSRKTLEEDKMEVSGLFGMGGGFFDGGRGRGRGRRFGRRRFGRRRFGRRRFDRCFCGCDP